MWPAAVVGAFAGTFPAGDDEVVVMQQNDTEDHPPSSRRAMTVAEFCANYSAGRTATYREIKAGRLSAQKCGRRTIISKASAEAWLQALPSMGTATTNKEGGGQ